MATNSAFVSIGSSIQTPISHSSLKKYASSLEGIVSVVVPAEDNVVRRWLLL